MYICICNHFFLSSEQIWKNIKKNLITNWLGKKIQNKSNRSNKNQVDINKFSTKQWNENERIEEE